MAADEVLERRLARRRAGTIEEPGTEYTAGELVVVVGVLFAHMRCSVHGDTDSFACVWFAWVECVCDGSSVCFAL